MFIFTQCAHNARCLQKEAHFKFGLHSENITRSQLQPFMKNTKNRISCLNFCGSCLDTYLSGYEISKNLDY